MRKQCVAMLTAISLMTTLGGCGCKHENYKPANCTTPKTCAECEKELDSALGDHVWSTETLKAWEENTCTICGEEGTSLWEELTDYAKSEGEKDGSDYIIEYTDDAKLCYDSSADELYLVMSFENDDIEMLVGAVISEDEQSVEGATTLTTDDPALQIDIGYHFTESGKLVYDKGIATYLDYDLDVKLSEEEAEVYFEANSQDLLWAFFVEMLEAEGFEDISPERFVG